MTLQSAGKGIKAHSHGALATASKRLLCLVEVTDAGVQVNILIYYHRTRCFRQ